MSFAKFDPWAALAEIREVRRPSPLSQPRRGPVADPIVEVRVFDQPLTGTVATVATVAGARAKNAQPSPARSWTARDWREYHEERLNAAMTRAQKPEAEARDIAREWGIARWLTLNPVASSSSSCCYCGGGGKEGVLVPFGSAPSAWLHHRCWRPWYDERRNRAVAALGEMVPDLQPDLQGKGAAASREDRWVGRFKDDKRG